MDIYVYYCEIEHVKLRLNTSVSTLKIQTDNE